VWRELPEGVAAMGNKVNALTPLLYVAADQRLYPYGSLIYLPAAVGVRVSGHPPLDGYFWVGDSGGAIRGNHFDLFVGDEALYNNLLLRNVAPHYKTTIYPLPKLPKAQDPRNDAGMAAILRRLRFLDAAAPPTPETLKAAVLAYQKSNPHIPPAEYGDPDAAATLWFLTQEALKAGDGAASP
jgi:3D (Asp-Asp-Asp) domain-containing protein